MAEKKGETKYADYVSNLKPTHLVEKSRPLSLMRTVPFTLGELKLMDVYISRLNIRDSKKNMVRFTKDEFEDLLGIEKTSLKELRTYTADFLGKIVEVPLENGYEQFVLFDHARVEPDENGVQIIYLSCTERAKKLFFDIEKMGYLRYQIATSLSLRHKSSYLLYLYVLRERYKGKWQISLKKLRENVFDLKNQKCYEEYKIFRRDVLDVAVNEINEKTGCNISYTPIKRKRTVTSIAFAVHKLEVIESEEFPVLPLPTEQTLDAEESDTLIQSVSQSEDAELSDSCADDDEKMTRIYGSEQLAQLAESLNYEFDRVQMEEIRSILCRIDIAPDKNTNSVHWGRVIYLRGKYATLNVESAKKERKGEHIRDRYAYFKKMLEQDVDE